MQRDLLIPYATNERTGEHLSAEALAERSRDWRDTVRLDATLDHNTATRQVTHYLCPACGSPVYPRAPVRPNGRNFWSHRPKFAESCPLAAGRPLSPNQINRLIFQGRQEGEAHRSLVALLMRLAIADPGTVKETVRTGEYERPTPDMLAEFPHGRFPDVAFTYGKTKVVLEAQLATITLHGINGRRAFYDRHGAALLWVTRNFDPVGSLRASMRDILADQRGSLFSVDQDALELSVADGIFRLRVWTYDLQAGKVIWTSEIRPLVDIIETVRPRPWSERFKDEFIEAYDGKGLHAEGAPDPDAFLERALTQIGALNVFTEHEKENMLVILSLLISLEAGRVVGSGHEKLISVANHFDYGGRHGYRNLVVRALLHWQPDLLKQPSMQTSLARAERKLQETSDKPFLRNSVIGMLRATLFPDWVLDEAEPPRHPAKMGTHE
jgi:hypothetical protein